MNSYKRNRIIFAVIFVIIALATNWPVYQWMSGAEPLIFGLPLSFAWLILWVIIGFFALLWLYISDNREPEHPEDL